MPLSWQTHLLTLGSLGTVFTFIFALGSVTRLGDLLDFKQLFKAFGNNLFAQISHILSQLFVKVSKSIILLVKSFFVQLL